MKIVESKFQGDSLSPLVFCLSIDPLSRFLNSEDGGYNLSPEGKISKTIGHLLYLDDLKLFACTDKLKKQVNTVKEFATEIIMKIALDKRATVSTKKGRRNRSSRKHNLGNEGGAKLHLTRCRGDKPDRM